MDYKNASPKNNFKKEVEQKYQKQSNENGVQKRKRRDLYSLGHTHASEQTLTSRRAFSAKALGFRCAATAIRQATLVYTQNVHLRTLDYATNLQ